MINSHLRQEDKDKMGFYTLTNIFTLETYSGSGVLGDCLKRHTTGYNNGNHDNRNLREAFTRTPDGWEFYAIPVEDYADPSDNRLLARTIEQSIIDEFIGKTPLFMNISKDAFACRPNWTPEQREHQLLVQKKRFELMTEEERKNSTIQLKRANLLRDYAPHTDITRQKISSSHKAEWSSLSEEEKKKRTASMVSALKGNKYSLGHKRSQESIEKQKTNATGLVRSTESRTNISKGRLAKTNPVVVDGIKYSSLTSASKETGIKVTTLCNRFDNENFPLCYRVKKIKEI
jgi:hypothetical protein